MADTPPRGRQKSTQQPKANENGIAEIDNTRAENATPPISLGRKNGMQTYALPAENADDFALVRPAANQGYRVMDYALFS